MTGTLKHDLLTGLWFYWLDLLSWLLHLLAGSLELHGCHSLRYTYCMHMHMHRVNIMYAQENEMT
jgi:hypothetical protein